MFFFFWKKKENNNDKVEEDCGGGGGGGGIHVRDEDAVVWKQFQEVALQPAVRFPGGIRGFRRIRRRWSNAAYLPQRPQTKPPARFS